MNYDDNYATCAKTYATLRFYHATESPEIVSRSLDLEPSSTQLAGKVNSESQKRLPFKLSGWFLSSRDKIESKDVRRHIDWLTDQLRQKKPVLGDLVNSGWKMDISCYWDSMSGHGGPTLSPEQARTLGHLGIEIWFDVYFKDAPCYDSKGNVLAH